MTFTLTFLGGADEVGASGILIELAGRRLLVDCGIRPSPKARWGLEGDQLPDLSRIDASGPLDAILVTHAHTDHTGALELVTQRFPGIPVYATPPTITLTRVLHQDARRIMQSRWEEEGELPLYDDLAVERLMAAFRPVAFHQPLALSENLTATYFPAGHIAGAAMIGLDSPDGRVLITGDLSISPQRTVDGARPPAFQPDVLVIESTYGGRLHANRQTQEKLLATAVNETVAGGGKVLIPAFALGRAQEVLLTLAEFRRQGQLPEVPVWADGMVRAVCQAYASFPEVLPLAFQERGAQFFDQLTRPVETRAQRNQLLWENGPAVIVSSSGMLAGGPAVEYARKLAPQPQHAILLTGYQDEESPGRRLQELAERGRGTLRLGKDKLDVACRLGTYSLSAHADEAQLLSLIERLNPSEVILVHGDLAARTSLEQALRSRQRPVHLPHSGQTLAFQFSRPVGRPRAAPGAGGRPLDLAALWRQVAFPAGGAFRLEDLANAWWEQPTPENLEALRQALGADGLYFVADLQRPGWYRAYSQQQVEALRRRRQRLAELGATPGAWLVLRGAAGQPRLVRCRLVQVDHLLVEGDDESDPLVWPEDVVAVLGQEAPPADILARYGMGRGPQAGAASALPVRMEPNQALAYATEQFPPEARLRKAGYRLEEGTLQLTFDFPDVVQTRYAETLERVAQETGWQVTLAPEANQAALFALAREILPAGWQVLKGPAVHRQTRQVALTAALDVGEQGARTAADAAAVRFQQESGYELVVSLVSRPSQPAAFPGTAAAAAGPGSGMRMEVNQAYALIKAELAGSSLYRVSQKGDEIMLSFISPQVGQRYAAQIEALAQQTGWPLSINPNPNQGEIQLAARRLIEGAGGRIIKGPGIYVERGEVTAGLADTPSLADPQGVCAAFEEQTGYRLALAGGSVSAAAGTPAGTPAAGAATAGPVGMAPVSAAGAASRPAVDSIEIPVERIALRPYHLSLELDPGKLLKAIERARRMGITPPVQVRRSRDGYVLMDGLYRLKAAQALGLERVPAVVE